MEDDEVLGFLNTCGRNARYAVSVCTGSLLLGAAGLLNGYRATCHWLLLPLLELLGAIPVSERVVIDRNRVTAAGVSAESTAPCSWCLCCEGRRWLNPFNCRLNMTPNRVSTVVP